MNKFEHIKLVDKLLDNKHLVSQWGQEMGSYTDVPKYDRMGDVISDELWDFLGSREEYWKICFDEFKEDELRICTMWTGYSFFTGVKAIFRTGLSVDGEMLNQMFSYADEDEAIHHHNKLVFLHEQKRLEEYLNC